MSHWIIPSVLLSASLSTAGLAQAPARAPAALDIYRDEPLVFEHYDTLIRMHADGTGETTVHVSVRMQSEGSARQFGVLSAAFASISETASIASVRVHKVDGTLVETPTADSIEMTSAVAREAPLYSDLKEQHLPVRSLAVGDTLEYEIRTIRKKAESPDQFWGSEQFVRTGAVVLSQTLTLEVPSAKYVQVWSPKHTPTITEHEGLRTYVWTSRQTKLTGDKGKTDESAKKAPAPADAEEDADGRSLPSVAWTTFHSWAEVGEWYRSLSLSRAEPTAAVRARADELTREAKTPDDQLRSIYSFVSTRTRYVGIDLGIGRYQPHPAAEVLANQYGDCKDKDTLLEALLRAKGFTASPALIGIGLTLLPEVPSPAVFNHVITTVDLPSGRIWLDTTAEVSPFRLLIPALRDQQALVIPSSSTATLQRTPSDPPYPFQNRFDAVGALDKDGTLKSHVNLSIRSDAELPFRMSSIAWPPLNGRR